MLLSAQYRHSSIQDRCRTDATSIHKLKADVSGVVSGNVVSKEVSEAIEEANLGPKQYIMSSPLRNLRMGQSS